ncbi:MAG: DotH/IcmK family type IV secretion protein [Gammaproteobacteria bacterium]|nr:DotH/IcmK family type IV secretion protein [Gammaproteobacteria bacterium]
MKTVIKTIITLSLISISVASFAAGFGVRATNVGQQTNNSNAQVDALLNQADKGVGGAPIANSNPVATASFGAPAPTPHRVQDKTGSIGSTLVSQQAFLQTVRNMLPLTPAQVHTLRTLLNRTQRAASEYPGTPPRPTSAAVMVNLAPGSTPPVIRLRKGFVTSLVFLDSTGAPWPISAYDIGNPKAFNVQWNKKGNTLLVQASDTYKSGNLAVILKGQNTPVMVTLMPGQAAVDYRVDLRVPGLGPNANPVLSNLPTTQSPQLLQFLNGIPPHGAKTLRVDGGDCQAWMFDDHIYLRTRLTVLSPGWLASMRSPDGTHVYEITRTPIILASSRGQIVQLEIQGL